MRARESLDDVKGDLEALWPDDFSETYVYEGEDEEDAEREDETRTVVRVGHSEEPDEEEIRAASRAARLERDELEREVEALTRRERENRKAAFAREAVWIMARKEEEQAGIAAEEGAAAQDVKAQVERAA